MSSTRSALGIRLASLACSVSMLTSACTAGDDPQSNIGGADVSASPSARSFELEGGPMRPCSSDGNDAVCGSLTVPEDRSDAGGRSIELKVVVIPAEDGEPAADGVFFLAGGPGDAATQTWANSATLFPRIHETRDIVLVDQRGTGGSNPLVLRDLPDLEGMSRQEIRTVIDGWADRAIASLDGDPRFYTSAVAVDDLDDVRAALGLRGDRPVRWVVRGDPGPVLRAPARATRSGDRPGWRYAGRRPAPRAGSVAEPASSRA